jgi:hypothetical protein
VAASLDAATFNAAAADISTPDLLPPPPPPPPPPPMPVPVRAPEDSKLGAVNLQDCPVGCATSPLPSMRGVWRATEGGRHCCSPGLAMDAELDMDMRDELRRPYSEDESGAAVLSPPPSSLS